MPAPPIDFRLYHGNDLEVLAGILARELATPAPGQSVLEPDTVLIPQPAMRRWLQKTLAESHGIAANLRFLAPGEFVREALDANLPGSNDVALGDAAVLRWRLWRLLSDRTLVAEPVFEPLRRALGDGDAGGSAWALAGELAEAFEKYQAWRRDWLRDWDRGGAPGDWQAELWRRASRGFNHRARRLDGYLSRFDGDAAAAPQGLPARVFAFACQNISPDVLRVIASSARAGTLHFFFLSPVARWWGDLETASERLRGNPDAVFGDEENPLLRANGAAGRDFIRCLFSYDVVHPSYELAAYAPPDPELRTGLLHRLQRALLERAPPLRGPHRLALPAWDDSARAERSLQVHACHTRLREVQVLHDQLRALLEADAGLQPRDIAVLTPDIDSYAAHVHAVFGGNHEALQQIPYALSDASALADQPLAEAFLRLLALPGLRFTANEVLELLAVPAIAGQLGLDAADFDLLHDCLRDAGARWGLDGAHRAALGAPAEEAYTWTWAIDRLLLGHASDSSDEVCGVAPLALLEGSALVALDALLQGLGKLTRLQSALGRAHTPAQWEALLAAAIDDLFGDKPDDLADRRALELLRAQVAAFGRQAAAAAVDEAVPLDVVVAWFRAALGDGDGRQPFLTGGVTFGRMVPMRLVPFKVICLLGMNDGHYPRRDPQGSLNRLSAELGTARRLVGDRSVRDDDRGLFLQLFAAATRVFYISYLGLDPRSGERLPPSVVVAELLEAAAGSFRDAEVADLLVEHPLQPFAAQAFGRGDARRISYAASWLPASQGADGARVPLPAFVGGWTAAPVPPGGVAPESPRRQDVAPELLTRDALFRGLGNPSREFLRARLGLRLPEANEVLPETEPFDRNDGLHRFQLSVRLFDAALAGETADPARLARRLLAEGLVAPGAAGRLEIDARLDVLTPALSAWQGWGADAGRTLAYEVPLGACTLAGALSRVHDAGLRQFSASQPHGKTLLGLGIDALVWSALGREEPVRRVLIGRDPEVLAALPAAEARERLRELVALLGEARERALPFMPRSAHAWFIAAPESAWGSARQCWLARDGHGEGADPWVRLALRGLDPFEDADPASSEQFRQLARRVFTLLPGVGAGHADD